MSQITLSKAVRSNLLNLQTTASLLGKSQERLSSGLRVNSALDNPTNFFTAQGLNSRANDLSQLADAVSNAVQTVAAADKGITAITKLVESAQATARQALQTAATAGGSSASVSTANTTTLEVSASRVVSSGFSALDVTNGSFMVGAIVDSVSNPNYAMQISSFNVDDYNTATGSSLDASSLSAADVAAMINHYNGPYGDAFAAEAEGGELVLTGRTPGLSSFIEVTDADPSGTVGGSLGFTVGATGGAGSGVGGNVVINGQTVSLAHGDDAASILSKFQAAANASSGSNEFTVSNAGGVLTFSGANSNSLTISGDDDAVDFLGLTETTIAGGGGANPKRAELVATYNDLLSQIDALAKDSGFNGVNLLNGDSLSVLFNEDGTSKLDIAGVTNDADTLGLDALDDDGFDTNVAINATLDDLKGAIEELRSQSAKFGANLSVVETRQEFTKNMISVLQTGAANLTLADANEEAANVLALQTRQQLSSTALSLASQADQNVLRLF